ncbi:MAG: acetolactate synthase small subunit [Patescibacteria group bacterium]
MIKTHTLVALVENKAGVLNRIASLFRRRRFNIESLTVGHSEKEGLSRMTIVVDKETNVDQVFRQMYKIVEVIKIKKLDEEKAIVRDLALVKVKLTPPTRAKILKTLNLFGAKIVKKNSKYLIAEICEQPEKIERFIDLMKDFGILEIARTGVTAVSS